jgi:hypothetical protein
MTKVLIVLAVLVFIAWMLWPRCPNCEQDDTKWVHVTPSHGQVVSSDNRDVVFNAWNKNWRLGSEGAFRFHVDKLQPGGLIVALQTSLVDEDTWSDQGEGYAIVLDNNDNDRPLSFVAALPHVTLPMGGSKQNQGFRFRDGWYWVQVKGGVIACGLGRELDQNKIVTCQPRYPLPVRFFGFGASNARTGLKDITGPLAQISNIEILQ